MSAPGDPYVRRPWADPDPLSKAARHDEDTARQAWRLSTREAADEERRLVRAAELAAEEDAEGWDDLTEGWDDEPPTPTVIARTDGACFGYEAQSGVIGGASEGGKTRVADLGTKQEADAGRPVVRWDLENGPALSRQALRDMGLTRQQGKELVRYKSASGLWTPAKASRESARFYDDGGRLAIFDSATAIAHALGLETSGGKSEDVQALYVQALRPWKEAGVCAIVLDNTNKTGLIDLSGSQHKKSGIDFGIGIVLKAPHGIGHHGSADVYSLKDRGSGHRWVGRQLAEGGEVYRLFGTLKSTPARHREGVRGRGTDFRIVPPEENQVNGQAGRDMEAGATRKLHAAALYNALPGPDEPGKNRGDLTSALRVKQNIRIGKSSDAWIDLITELGERVVQEPGRQANSTVYRRAK